LSLYDNRLAYEVILPYALPIVLLAFPYVAMLMGLMRTPGHPAAAAAGE